MSRSDYRTCPYCGASLDIGEECDCQQQKPEESAQDALMAQESAQNHISVRECAKTA